VDGGSAGGDIKCARVGVLYLPCMYAQIGPKRVADDDIDGDSIAVRNAKLAAQRKTELINYYTRVAKMCVSLARKLRNEKFASALELTSATLLIGDERPRASQYADVIRLLETLAVDAAAARAAIRIDAPYEPVDVAARAIKIRDAIARAEKLARLDAMTGEGTYFEHAPADMRRMIAYREDPLQLLAHEALDAEYSSWQPLRFGPAMLNPDGSSDKLEYALIYFSEDSTHNILISPACKRVNGWDANAIAAFKPRMRLEYDWGRKYTIGGESMGGPKTQWTLEIDENRITCTLDGRIHVFAGNLPSPVAEILTRLVIQDATPAGRFLVAIMSREDDQYHIVVFAAANGTIDVTSFSVHSNSFNDMVKCVVDNSGNVWIAINAELTVYTRTGDVIARRVWSKMPNAANVNEMRIYPAADGSIWVFGIERRRLASDVIRTVSRIRVVPPAAFTPGAGAD